MSARDIVKAAVLRGASAGEWGHVTDEIADLHADQCIQELRDAGYLPTPSGPMKQPEGAAPWWGYGEKDAWFDFADSAVAPAVVAAIEDVLPVHDLQRGPNASPDPVLSSGVQIEGLWLRIAELLGYVRVEREP